MNFSNSKSTLIFFLSSMLIGLSTSAGAQNNYFDPGVHSDDIKPIHPSPMPPASSQYFDPNSTYPQSQQDIERMERYNHAMEKLRKYSEDGFISQRQSPKYQNRVPPKATFNKRPSPTASDIQDDLDYQNKAYERMREIYPGR